MKTLSVLLISIVFAIYANDLASSYKVDYTNGHNKIHFENNRYLNGKPVNEPKIEEAIQTLSKLGFKPDSAKILTENEQTDRHNQQMIQNQQQQHQNQQMSNQNQQLLQQQHQQFLQHQQQLQMQKRMPNMGPREGVVNLSLRQKATNTNEETAKTADPQNHKLTELQELAGVKSNIIQNFQPTIDSITHQNQNNKALDKIMSMRNYLPYFKAKYGLGDDFVDPLGEELEEQNELLALPLLYNAARGHPNTKPATETREASEASGAVRPLSAFAFPGNMNGYPENYNPMAFNAPNNYPSQYPQAQPNYLPQPQVPQYIPKPQAAPKQTYVPTKESYSANNGPDSDTSDIFITNINENYNNLNNTQTENTISKSTNADRTYNRNDDKSAYKTSSYV